MSVISALTSWQYELLPNPPIGIRLEGFHTYGFMQRVVNGAKEWEVPNDAAFAVYLGENQVPYHAVRSKLSNTLDATKRYLGEDTTGMTLKHKCALDVAKRFFSFATGTCSSEHWRDCHTKRPAAAGHLEKSLLGCKNKGDIIDNYAAELDWYQKYAHVVDLPVLWTASGKEEILPDTKVEDGVCRTFTFPGGFYAIGTSGLYSGMKNLFKMFAMCPQWPFKVGCVFARGGFNSMVEAMEGMLVIQSDVSKWDGSYRLHVHQFVQEVIKLFKEDYGDFDDWAATKGYYSIVLLPNGQVVLVLRKKSGDPFTSHANCIGHFLVICLWAMRVASETRQDPLVVLRECVWCLYADDTMNGVPEKYREFTSYEFMQKCYTYAKMAIKPPPHYTVFEGPVGATFLGAKVKRAYGMYVPEYTKDRLLAALQCRRVNDEELRELMVSLMPLLRTNDDARGVVMEYLATVNVPLRNVLLAQLASESPFEAARRNIKLFNNECESNDHREGEPTPKEKEHREKESQEACEEGGEGVKQGKLSEGESKDGPTDGNHDRGGATLRENAGTVFCSGADGGVQTREGGSGAISTLTRGPRSDSRSQDTRRVRFNDSSLPVGNDATNLRECGTINTDSGQGEVLLCFCPEAAEKRGRLRRQGDYKPHCLGHRDPVVAGIFLEHVRNHGPECNVVGGDTHHDGLGATR